MEQRRVYLYIYAYYHIKCIHWHTHTPTKKNKNRTPDFRIHQNVRICVFLALTRRQGIPALHHLVLLWSTKIMEMTESGYSQRFGVSTQGPSTGPSCLVFVHSLCWVRSNDKYSMGLQNFYPGMSPLNTSTLNEIRV